MSWNPSQSSSNLRAMHDHDDHHGQIKCLVLLFPCMHDFLFSITKKVMGLRSAAPLQVPLKCQQIPLSIVFKDMDQKSNSKGRFGLI